MISYQRKILIPVHNKVADFLLPLLGKSKNLYHPYHINTYIKDESTPDLNDNKHLFILLKFSGQIAFNHLVKWLENHPCYRGQYDLYDNEYIMYILKIPIEFYSEVDYFLQGKYSSFSEKAQRLILANRSVDSIMSHIFTRSDYLRNLWNADLCDIGQMNQEKLRPGDELWPIINVEAETFNKDKFFQTYIKATLKPVLKSNV